MQANSTHKVPHTQEHRSSRPFEIIYRELSGMSPVPSYGNTRYYMTFIDDFTRMR